MTLKIRPAEPRDLPGVIALLRQLSDGRTPGVAWPVTTVEEGADVWTEVLAQPGRAFLVADEDGPLVGTVDLFILPNLTHGASPIAYMENVVVDRERRGSGVGLSLVSEVERRAREAGCYKIQLISHTAREQAYRFYEAVGFEPSATGFRKYLRNDD